jgi:hypothetical protein
MTMSEGIGYSYHSAFFANSEDAQSAFDDVISLGIPEEHISLTQGSPETAPRNPRKELNFIDFNFSGIFSRNNKAKEPQGTLLMAWMPLPTASQCAIVVSIKSVIKAMMQPSLVAMASLSGK